MLDSLDSQVDPCGENGEFHSFATNGPIFNKPIPVEVKQILLHTYEHQLQSGQKVETAFEFADLRLAKPIAV